MVTPLMIVRIINLINFITFINTRFEDYGKIVNTKFEDFEKLVNTRFTENEKLDEVKAAGLDTALQLAKDHVSIKMEELNNLRKEVTEGRIVFLQKKCMNYMQNN